MWEVSAFSTMFKTPGSLADAESDIDLLKYLKSLTYTFERNGDSIDCLLIYAEPDPQDPSHYVAVVANDTGYEGIACVDDTARAVLLALAIHERTGSQDALQWAKRWMSFVTYMQYADGSFANFVRNPAGVRNATGPTSRKGGHAWTARGLWALARMYRVTGDQQYREHYLACTLAGVPDGKIQAMQILADAELYQASPSGELRDKILAHCDCILALGPAPYFHDQPNTLHLDLWGYHQLHAVASAASLVERSDLVRSCRETIEHLVQEDVAACFWVDYPERRKDGLCAYNISPMVQGLDAMYRTTAEEKYRELALLGADWLYGRNDAGEAMYDPATGMCRDGINGGRVSENFGAESAIEAGFIELVRRSLR